MEVTTLLKVKILISTLSTLFISACSITSSVTTTTSDLRTLNLSVAPISVAAGTEQTNCVTLRLPNDGSAIIRKISLQSDPGVAQIIIYSSTATTEVPSPGVSCTSFGGISASAHPLFMSNEPSAILSFPVDASSNPIGPVIADNQMILIEVHLYNSTASPLSIGATLSVDVLPSNSNSIASDMALLGTTNLNTAPHATSTASIFHASLPSIHVFAVNTQQWHFGTEVKIYRSTNSSDRGEMLLDTTNWANPTVRAFSPDLDMSSKGLLMDCSTNNTSNAAVSFGGSVQTDDSCFVWEYYYPAAGFHKCIDAGCTTVP